MEKKDTSLLAEEIANIPNPNIEILNEARTVMTELFKFFKKQSVHSKDNPDDIHFRCHVRAKVVDYLNQAIRNAKDGKFKKIENGMTALKS